MIEGGYYIKARKIQESDIAHAPPHVREIWDWFIKEANHKDNKTFKRGQCLRSIKNIQEGLSWSIGYRKMSYKKHQCEFALNWLRKHGMITTSKTTRGMLVTICKYDTYQDPKNYESNTGASTKPTRVKQDTDTINKKVKNAIKNKEDCTPLQIFIIDTYSNVTKLRDQLTKIESEKITEQFSKTLIKSKLDAMENKKSLVKDYLSVYLTLLKWCKMQVERTGGKNDRYQVGNNKYSTSWTKK